MGSLLKELIECFSDVVAIDFLRATPRCQGDAVVWLEIVTKIRFELIAYIFRRWFAALIVLARIEEATVLAAMNVRTAMRTFVRASKLSNYLDLASAIVTDHRLSSQPLQMSRRQPQPSVCNISQAATRLPVSQFNRQGRLTLHPGPIEGGECNPMNLRVECRLN